MYSIEGYQNIGRIHKYKYENQCQLDSKKKGRNILAAYIIVIDNQNVGYIHTC